MYCIYVSHLACSTAAGSIRELDRLDLVYGMNPTKVTVLLNRDDPEGHERFFWSLESEWDGTTRLVALVGAML